MKDKTREEEIEQKIIDYMEEYTKKNDYSPTIREICEAVGFKSTNTGHNYVTRLIEKGRICKSPIKSRTLQLVRNELTADEMFEKLRI